MNTCSVWNVLSVVFEDSRFTKIISKPPSLTTFTCCNFITFYLSSSYLFLYLILLIVLMSLGHFARIKCRLKSRFKYVFRTALNDWEVEISMVTFKFLRAANFSPNQQNFRP